MSLTAFTQLVLQYTDRTEIDKLVKYLHSTLGASIDGPLYV